MTKKTDTKTQTYRHPLARAISALVPRAEEVSLRLVAANLRLAAMQVEATAETVVGDE